MFMIYIERHLNYFGCVPNLVYYDVLLFQDWYCKNPRLYFCVIVYYSVGFTKSTLEIWRQISIINNIFSYILLNVINCYNQMHEIYDIWIKIQNKIVIL